MNLIAIVNLNESAYSGHNSLFRNNEGLAQSKMLDYLMLGITKSDKYKISTMSKNTNWLLH